MKSVCVTKAKAYYIIADGYTECYTFIREIYRITTDIIIREVYQNVD